MESIEGIKDVLNIMKSKILDYEDEDILEDLGRYYNDENRHYYHEIAEFIYENDESDDVDFIIERIGTIIREDICKGSKLNNKVKKLYDHLKLEKIRLNKMKAEYSDLSKSILGTENAVMNTVKSNIRDNLNHQTKLESTVKGTEEKMSNFDEKLNRSEKKLNEFNTQSITVRSIFAGVVMAFFGGMSFFTETFKVMGEVSKYRLFMTVLLVGFFIFNTIFILINLSSKIIDVDIRSKSVCLDRKCVCNKGCNIVNRARYKYPMVFYFDILILAMMVMVIALWYLHYWTGLAI